MFNMQQDLEERHTDGNKGRTGKGEVQSLYFNLKRIFKNKGKMRFSFQYCSYAKK